MKTRMRVAVSASLCLASTLAAAHGGGLDAGGCHHDRKHGGYHCHRGAPAAPTAHGLAPSTAPMRRAAHGRPGSVAYANCRAARAAGAAPVRRGDAGYAPHLDRDGDGVGCE